MKSVILVILMALVCAIAHADEEPVYIDVRTWAEHKISHIEGDPRIHVSQIVEGVTAQFPDKSTPIRLYCVRGVRAQTAMERLQAEGYSDVENAGGIDHVRSLRFPDSTQ